MLAGTARQEWKLGMENRCLWLIHDWTETGASTSANGKWKRMYGNMIDAANHSDLVFLSYLPIPPIAPPHVGDDAAHMRLAVLHFMNAVTTDDMENSFHISTMQCINS